MKRKWIFADWKLPTAADIDLIRQLGFTDVVLGLGLMKQAYGSFYCPSKMSAISACATSLRSIDVRVHVMTWIKRNRTFIKDMASWIRAVSDAVSPASVLLDAEGMWHKGAGISAGEGAALVQQLLPDLPCRLGVTGLSNLHGSVKPLLRVCDYGLCQAYSIWKPRDPNHWSHGPGTAPGAQQQASFASWKTANKPLVMGLSNYWAARPANSGAAATSATDSLQQSLDGAIAAGATEVAFWSLKWLRKTTPDGATARAFTAGIAIDNPSESTDTGNGASSVQWLLVQLGYNLGTYGRRGDGVDGNWGNASQQALNKFRATEALPTSGAFQLSDVTALISAYRQKTSP